MPEGAIAPPWKRCRTPFSHSSLRSLRIVWGLTSKRAERSSTSTCPSSRASRRISCWRGARGCIGVVGSGYKALAYRKSFASDSIDFRFVSSIAWVRKAKLRVRAMKSGRCLANTTMEETMHTRTLTASVMTVAVAVLFTAPAFGGVDEAKKWIDSEFQPSVLSKEEQLKEMQWFIEAA